MGRGRLVERSGRGMKRRRMLWRRGRLGCELGRGGWWRSWGIVVVGGLRLGSGRKLLLGGFEVVGDLAGSRGKCCSDIDCCVVYQVKLNPRLLRWRYDVQQPVEYHSRLVGMRIDHWVVLG